jgi:hypothetical protein
LVGLLGEEGEPGFEGGGEAASFVVSGDDDGEVRRVRSHLHYGRAIVQMAFRDEVIPSA